MLRLPNALRCRFTVASGILKHLEYISFRLMDTVTIALPATVYFCFFDCFMRTLKSIIALS
ncbi:MAG: hypothetical protein LBJ00_00215 [Planctomycetaceae bacterium]|nr:hypothetical protein [Planctomycetaceae bacterium]